jgi:branched-chain amino acid transport system ATP-binding protein
MTDAILSVRQLTKRYGGLVANNAIDLDFPWLETHAVIGPNGAGKTTLIAQLAGEIKPDHGTIQFEGRDVTEFSVDRRARMGLTRSYQVTSVMPSLTALEGALLGAMAGAGRGRSLLRAAESDPRLQIAARDALDQVGLGGRANVPAHRLSHGERRQLEVAMALAAGPRMLLLDEPTAGMGRDESERMIGLISTLKGRLTIMLVEHDMDVVFAVADRVTVLAGGCVIATDCPDEIRQSALVRQAYLGGGEL